MDAVSKTRIVGLHPVLIARLVQLDDILMEQGVNFRINVGIRSWALQQSTYNSGRTVPGTILTYALPGHSWHQYGFAIDGCPMVPGPQGATVCDWDAAGPNWAKVYQAVSACKLLSGHSFTQGYRDDDHIQLADIPESPTDEDVQTLKDAGMTTVWNKYFPGTVMP